MIETKVKGITHIGPSKVNNAQAVEIITGPFAIYWMNYIEKSPYPPSRLILTS